jgi:hypothetical protein
VLCDSYSVVSCSGNWDNLGMTHPPGFHPLSEYGRRAQAIKAADRLVNKGAGPLLVLHDLQCGGFSVHPVAEGEDLEFLSGKRSGYEILYRTEVDTPENMLAREAKRFAQVRLETAGFERGWTWPGETGP